MAGSDYDSSSDGDEHSGEHSDDGDGDERSDKDGNEDMAKRWKLSKAHDDFDEELEEALVRQQTSNLLLVNSQIHHEFAENIYRASNIWLYVHMSNTADSPHDFVFDQAFSTLPYLRNVRRLFVIAAWSSSFAREARGEHPPHTSNDPRVSTFNYPVVVNNKEAAFELQDLLTPSRTASMGNGFTTVPMTAYHVVEKLPEAPELPFDFHTTARPLQPADEALATAVSAYCQDVKMAYEALGTTVNKLLEHTPKAQGLDISIKTTGYERGNWKYFDDIPDPSNDQPFLVDVYPYNILHFKPEASSVKYIVRMLIQDDVAIRRTEETFIEETGVWEDYLGGTLPYSELLRGKESFGGTADWNKLSKGGPYVMKRNGPDNDWTDWEID